MKIRWDETCYPASVHPPRLLTYSETSTGGKGSHPALSFASPAPIATQYVLSATLRSTFVRSVARQGASRMLLSRAPSVKRTAMVNAIGYFVAIAVSFIQAPFLVHRLGEERYGVWTLIGTVTGYYGLLDFGTRAAVGLLVARARARGEDIEVAELTASAFWFLVVAGIVVLAIGSVVLWLFPNMFHIAEAWRSESRAALAITLALVVLTLPLDVWAAIVNGSRRGDILMATDTMVRVLTFALIIVLFQRGARLDHLAAIQVVGKLIVWTITYFAAKRLEPAWRLSLKFWRPTRLREIMRYSFQTFIINVAGTIVEKLDAVVIAFVLGASRVTYYYIGQSLVLYMVQGVSSITLAFTPFFADLHAKEETTRVRGLYFAGTRVASIVAGVLAGGVVVFGRPFLIRWMGEWVVQGPWYNRSDTVLYIVLAAMLPRLIHSASHQYIFGSNRQAFLSRLTVVEGIANLALSIALAKPLGLAGIALGTAIPSIIAQGWFLPRHVARWMETEPWLLFVEGQLRGLLGGVVIAAAGLLVRTIVPVDTWHGFFAAVFLTVLLAAPVLWVVALAPDDRALARSIVARLMPTPRTT
jgi:O-antigen/teichoic acid export membrane protein